MSIAPDNILFHLELVRRKHEETSRLLEETQQAKEEALLKIEEVRAQIDECTTSIEYLRKYEFETIY